MRKRILSWAVAMTLVLPLMTSLPAPARAAVVPVSIFSEGFESPVSAAVPPAGWALSGTADAWAFGPAVPPMTAAGGSIIAEFRSFGLSAGLEGKLYRTAGVELEAGEEYRLSFKLYHTDTWAGSNDLIQVQVSDDLGTTWSTVDTVTRYSVTPGWLEHTVSLNAYAGQDDVRIAFNGISAYGGDIFIDEVSIAQLVENTPPSLTAGTAQRLSDTQATVSFTSSKAGSCYWAVAENDALEPDIDTDAAGEPCGTSEKTVSLSGLNTGEKDVYIKVKDALGSVSESVKLDLPAYTGPVTDDDSFKAAGITHNTAVLVWNKATDDVTAQNELTYTVYYSQAEMTGISSVESGTRFGSETADIAGMTVSGLSANTEYYFGVIVTDGDGHKSCMITGAQTALAAPWTYVGPAGFSPDNVNFTSLCIYDGTPYVAYMDDAAGDRATLMKYDAAAGWQAVGGAGFTAGYADLISLYITPDGTPYVAFRDGTQSYKTTVMKYAAPGGWQLVGSAGFSGDGVGDITVVVDNGDVYVALRDNSTLSRATVKKFDSGINTWVTLGPAGGMSVGSAASLSLCVLDGVPTVAYSDLAPPPNNCGVKVRAYNSGTNTWEPVGEAGLSGIFSQYVAIGSYQDGAAQSPVIAYSDRTRSDAVTVRRYDSGSGDWVCVGEPGFSVGDVYNLCVANDGADYYVAYNGMTVRKATVMKFDGTQWVSVGREGFSAGNTDDLSFALDTASGIPYVSYRDDAVGAHATVMKYEPEVIAPQVSHVTRQSPAQETTNASSVTFRVTFSEGVTGVGVSDFTLSLTDTAAGTVSSVTAVSDAVYDVTVGSITGTGTIKLNVKNSGTGIADQFANALSGGFTDGEAYSVSPAASGGGGSSAPAAIVVTAQDVGGATHMKTVIEATQSAGKASADVSGAVFDALLDKAQARQATGRKDLLEITLDADENTNALELSLARSDLARVSRETDAGLSVTSPFISVTFDGKALEAIAAASDGQRVVFTAGQLDKTRLSEEDRARVADRPVYDFGVTVGDRQVSRFGGGHALVKIPYTLRAGENPHRVVVYYLGDDGKLKTVRGHYNPKTGMAEFKTTHFSKFVVGYNDVAFEDVPAGVWYKDAVDFISARGITTGTAPGRFSPGVALTRGQFVVMLLRAYQIDPAEDATTLSGNFADAGNTYYTPYLAAARKLGIANGMGGGMFAPDREISRQEMFVLLYNALNVLDELPSAVNDTALAQFGDAGQIASWADEALGALVRGGIVSGRGNLLCPKSATTRGEMAQVLYSLLSK